MIDIESAFYGAFWMLMILVILWSVRGLVRHSREARRIRRENEIYSVIRKHFDSPWQYPESLRRWVNGASERMGEAEKRIKALENPPDKMKIPMPSKYPFLDGKENANEKL